MPPLHALLHKLNLQVLENIKKKLIPILQKILSVSFIMVFHKLYSFYICNLKFLIIKLSNRL